jgi:Fructose-2,6-bisphosphatase
MNNTMTATYIDILRHSECEGGHIFRGKTDVALLPKGLQHMQDRIAALDQSWDCIISSPLVRCREYAEHLHAQTGTTLIIEPRIQEMSFGDWEGVKIDQLIASANLSFLKWQQNPADYSPPGGEPLADVKTRLEQFFIDLMENHAGKKVLLVTHGGVIRVLLSYLLNMPLQYATCFDVPYACFSRVGVFDDEKNRVIKLLAHNLTG